MAIALAWALGACNTSEPQPPTVVDHFDLVANVPIAAAQLEVTRPAGTASVTAVALQPDVIVRMAEEGDRIHIVWVGPVAVAGAQVRLDVERAEGTSGGAEIVEASAYATPTGPDVAPGALAWRTVAGSVVSDGPVGTVGVDFGSMSPLKLATSFADHPLGDLNEDQSLDVRDALVWLDLIRYGNWTDFLRYHADFDVDDDADADDLAALLEKLVDPSLPASLHVRPAALSFVELDPAVGEDAFILVANRGRLPLDFTVEVPEGITEVTVRDDRSAVVQLSLPGAERRGWLPGYARVIGATGDEAAVRLGHFVFLVAGQSNASGRGLPVYGWPEVASPFVRALANDYRWKAATEPLDVATDQRDPVSADSSAAYSFGTRLGHLLWAETGFPVYLIPSAKGASVIAEWLPTATSLYSLNLFESATDRAQISAGLATNPVSAQPFPSEGGPVTALIWYQGESDATSSAKRNAFVADTNTVMNAFVSELGTPVIFVQLASHREEGLNEQQLAIAELQRRMETGSGWPQARASEFHMVVAMDLPRSDHIHPSAFGQRVLAERIELAIREHVLGEDVDGTGPRLVAVRASGVHIDVETTHLLASGISDRGLFRVYNGEPSGNLEDIENYGDNAIPIVSVERHPSDPRTVRITLQDAPVQTPWVRYWPLPTLNPEPEATWDDLVSGVIRAEDGGLPLPGFGPIAVP